MMHQRIPSRLGIFGGTFDPPHIGHLILAAEARQQFSLERVLWVLTPDPPHKTDRCISPLIERQRMLEVIIAEDPDFELSAVDILRPPPHYAVDTMLLLRQEHPEAILVYLMGGDSLFELPTWHEPRRFVQVCDEIGVMLRPGREANLDEIETVLPGIRAKLRFMRAPLLEISSSEIRRRISLGLPYRYYLPPQVYQIIQEETLYREML